MEKKGFGEFVRFGLVGAFCTFVHYGLYYLLMRSINVNIAYTIGYAVSFAANFFLTSYFTFKVLPSLKKLLGMGGAHGINFLLHLGLLNLFLYLHVPEAWAPIPVFAIAIPVNFLLIRFVFKNRRL